MKKHLFALAILAASGIASAQSYHAINQGSISNTVHAVAAVNGAGSSYSVAKGDASSIAHATVSTLGLPGYSGQQQALTGNTSTSVTGVAYNTVTGAGVGSASSIGNAAAHVDGWTSFNTPHQALAMNGDATSTSGGAVIAGTAQDGFFGGSATAGFAVNGYVGSTGIPGGSQIVGGVFDSKYATADVGAGAVTFPGGAPAGQTAAVRGATADGIAHAAGSFSDPAGQ
ncbi:hypothetical protein [Variovorax sp. PAMC 28711]|uniref:hypothetical protein n=1 Tax=Variovorax sp. PAMC 28711 TaxID=1795631 RepID=UPI00078C1D72|nr:hypothetical protein [Variovorax sp. PAMC 28711]AMM23023.1 hypothetical protein AX767_00470 [Variovorax sp. PAMC 28711]